MLSEASSGIAVRAASSRSSVTAASSTSKVQHKPVVQANEDFKTEVFVQELRSIADKLGSVPRSPIDPLPSTSTALTAASHARGLHPAHVQGRLQRRLSVHLSIDRPRRRVALHVRQLAGSALAPRQAVPRARDRGLGSQGGVGSFRASVWNTVDADGGTCGRALCEHGRCQAVRGRGDGNLDGQPALADGYVLSPSDQAFGIDFAGDVEAARKEGKKVKHKIIFEQKAFPSDQYALASVNELNGFDPKTSMVPLVPKEGSKTLETADILATIEKCGQEGETSMVLIGGIQYFTGQLFELEKLAAKAHEYGILFGVDLAHAFANVPLALHDWGIDFACWCTYKYGSSGPGGIAGLFVHEKWHHANLTRQADGGAREGDAFLDAGQVCAHSRCRGMADFEPFDARHGLAQRIA